MAYQPYHNAREDFTDGWLAIFYVEFEHLGQARTYSETIAMTIV